MDFDQARKAFDDLLSAYQAGKINAEQFENSANLLVVSDPAGTLWQIGVRTGKWYRYDGKAWVEDTPAALRATEQPRWVQPPEGAVPPAYYAAAPPRSGPKWGRIFMILGLVGLGLTAICCLVIVGYLVWTGQVQIF
jgi:hypothetical protein